MHGIQGDPVTKDIEEKNKSRACFFFLIASPHPQIKLLSKGERGFFLPPAALPNAFRFLPPRIFHVGSRGWRARHSGATAGGPLFGEAPTRVGFAAPREAAAAFLRGAPGPESGARRGPRGVGQPERRPPSPGGRPRAPARAPASGRLAHATERPSGRRRSCQGPCCCCCRLRLLPQLGARLLHGVRRSCSLLSRPTTFLLASSPRMFRTKRSALVRRLWRSRAPGGEDEEEGAGGGGGGGELRGEGATDGRAHGAGGGGGAGRAVCCLGKAVRGAKGHHHPHPPAAGAGAAGGGEADLKALTHSVLKKLKERQLELLLQAVESRGGTRTACLLLPGRLDCRLGLGAPAGSQPAQPPSTYSLPLLLCKVFRWPDLRHSSEVKRLCCCESYGKINPELVCCNPHHLSRLCELGKKLIHAHPPVPPPSPRHSGGGKKSPIGLWVSAATSPEGCVYISSWEEIWGTKVEKGPGETGKAFPRGSLPVFSPRWPQGRGGCPWALLIHARILQTWGYFRISQGGAERSGGGHASPARRAALRCVADLDSIQARQGRLGEAVVKAGEEGSPLGRKGERHVGRKGPGSLPWPAQIWVLRQ